MSDSPRTALAYWQELQKTKCELAAAHEQLRNIRNECEANIELSLSQARKALAEKDKRIAELEKLIPLVSEVMANHRDPQSGEYNECEKSPCMWCDLAQKAIDAVRKED